MVFELAIAKVEMYWSSTYRPMLREYLTGASSSSSSSLLSLLLNAEATVNFFTGSTGFGAASFSCTGCNDKHTNNHFEIPNAMAFVLVSLRNWHGNECAKFSLSLFYSYLGWLIWFSNRQWDLRYDWRRWTNQFIGIWWCFHAERIFQWTLSFCFCLCVCVIILKVLNPWDFVWSFGWNEWVFTSRFMFVIATINRWQTVSAAVYVSVIAVSVAWRRWRWRRCTGVPVSMVGRSRPRTRTRTWSRTRFLFIMTSMPVLLITTVMMCTWNQNRNIKLLIRNNNIVNEKKQTKIRLFFSFGTNRSKQNQSTQNLSYSYACRPNSDCS